MTIDFGNIDDMFGTNLEQKPSVKEVIKRSRCMGRSETEKNEALSRSLKYKGISAEASRRGVDISGKDFSVECKEKLVSRSVLYSLKGQIDDYVRKGVDRLYVVIHGDAKRELLNELRVYCSEFSFCDIEVIIKGCVLPSNKKDEPTEKSRHSLLDELDAGFKGFEL